MGRGALVFKGETAVKKKKKKSSKHHHHSSKKPRKPDVGDDVGDVHEASVVVEGTSQQLFPNKKPAVAGAAPPALQIKTGSGKITSSGTVVTGHETRFLKEIHAGDAILVQVTSSSSNKNQQKEEEMRVVTMRLSDISLNLSSPFTQNLSTPVSFQYINKPSAARAAGKTTEAGSNKTQEDAAGALGMYDGGSSNNELVYREKTEHGSYRIKRVKVGGQDGTSSSSLSRQDLLEMRTKKKSDKYC
jgi:hypothetical protein